MKDGLSSGRRSRSRGCGQRAERGALKGPCEQCLSLLEGTKEWRSRATMWASPRHWRGCPTSAVGQQSNSTAPPLSTPTGSRKAKPLSLVFRALLRPAQPLFSVHSSRQGVLALCCFSPLPSCMPSSASHFSFFLWVSSFQLWVTLFSSEPCTTGMILTRPLIPTPEATADTFLCMPSASMISDILWQRRGFGQHMGQARETWELVDKRPASLPLIGTVGRHVLCSFSIGPSRTESPSSPSRCPQCNPCACTPLLGSPASWSCFPAPSWS